MVLMYVELVIVINNVKQVASCWSGNKVVLRVLSAVAKQLHVDAIIFYKSQVIARNACALNVCWKVKLINKVKLPGKSG